MIRIKTHNSSAEKVIIRLKKRARIRKKVQGNAERPRLAVFRSGRHIYAQIIDDGKGVTIASASTAQMEIGKGVKKVDAAKQVGQELAKLALAKKVKDVVFDRSGYVYHGRIKAVADGARESGLNF